MLKMYEMYELKPDRWQNQQSFYGKATVAIGEGKRILKSYDTVIMTINDITGEVVRHWDGWSATTGRHIKAFSGLNKKEYFELPLVKAGKVAAEF